MNDGMKQTPTQLSDRLQLGWSLHRQGRSSDAQHLFEEIVVTHPQNFEAVYQLGVFAGQGRNFQRAAELFSRAVVIKPDSAEAVCNLGLALHELGQLENALICYERAIEMNPGFAGAHCKRSNLLHAMRRYDEALESSTRAIELRADFAEAFCNQGNALQALGRPEAALRSYQRAIEIKADYFDAHCNQGIALRQIGRLEPAIAAFQRAVLLQPGHAAAHYNLAYLLCEQHRWLDALAEYDRAIAAKPEDALARSERGIVLRRLNRFEEALASHDLAIAIHHDSASSHVNRGNVLCDMRRWDEALGSYDRAIVIAPDLAEAHFAKATVLLTRAEFPAGWAEYEWRFKLANSALTIAPHRAFSQPRWDGIAPLEGRHILLHAEQGLGDTLQFCRYAAAVAQRGGRVILEVQEPLVNLLQGVEGASKVVARGAMLPHFDIHMPLLSLPLAFGTRLETIPARQGYLRADDVCLSKWRGILGIQGRRRIGLAWRGNPQNANDHNRSIGLRRLMDGLPRGYEYVSLHRELIGGEREVIRAMGITHVGEQQSDFADAAAICECMDLVISVDTSLAHLSASLGKATWMLLSYTSDWRWLLDRSDSPWYPSMKLFRQMGVDHWGELLEGVSAALLADKFPA
jgi:tetratricopeptide (TPR) repeat protein